MRIIQVLTLAVSSLTLAGCAGMKFYTNPGMSRGSEVGLKYYYAKPYILVARDGTSKVTSVTVTYLPDLANPVWAKPRSGYGSANLSLAFSNGMITSFGQITDTKIPETFTSLAAIETALGAATKARAEAHKLRNEAADFPKHAQPLRDVATQLRTLSEEGFWTTSERAKLLSIAGNLYVPESADVPATGLAIRFDDPSAAANESALIEALGKLVKSLASIKPPEPRPEGQQAAYAKLERLQGELSAMLKDLKPAPVEPAALTLYEVVLDNNGQTTLREVIVP